MPLSPQMRQDLLARLAAADTSAGPIRLVGPELHCATVEDAEKLVHRFTGWQRIFIELRKTSTLREDRESLGRLYDTYEALLVDLKNSIHLTREHGVPWEKTHGVAERTIQNEFTRPRAWSLGDRVRVLRGKHEGRTGTVSLLPSSPYAPYVPVGDGQVQVALDGEPGAVVVGTRARAKGGRGGVPIVIDNTDLETHEGPGGVAVGRDQGGART